MKFGEWYLEQSIRFRELFNSWLEF